MRIAGFLMLIGLAGPAMAVEQSVTCAVELGRRQAIAISDYAEPIPVARYWVGVDGKSVGPWSVIEIKRRMLRGELPPDVWVYGVQGKEWVLTSQSQDFMPLPMMAPLAPAERDQTLPQLLTGCWVSDPVSEAAGQETVWIFLLDGSGVLFPSRAVETLADGREGFWFSRSSTARWQVKDQAQARFTLALPDINYLDPQDDFAAELVGRNELRLELPGIGVLTLRRM